MLTTGEIVTALCRFYLGVQPQSNDVATREKALWFAQEGCERLWSLAPVWWREASSGSISITGAQTYGDMPSDFAHMGTHGQVYVSGQTSRDPLQYQPPDFLRDMLARTTSTVTYPTHYTLEGRTTAGLPKIRVAPMPSATLTLSAQGYVRNAPKLLDTPVAPSSAAGASGLLTGGAYLWRLTFTTATGETEGGYPSTSLSLTDKQASLTNLPIPPSWLAGVITGKKLYRTVAGGATFKLVAAMSTIEQLTYTDAVADGSLGATCPTPATATGTGVEQFPEDWQRALIFRYAEASVAQKQGDVRDRAWFDGWQEEARRMWSEWRQGQNTVHYLPRYGTIGISGSKRSFRDRLS